MSIARKVNGSWQEIAGATPIDVALSPTSTNPVQNRVIYGALDDKQDTLIAGTNITIAADGKTISAAGGGSSNFVGTTAEWNALTDAEKAEYDTYDLTDDFDGVPISYIDNKHKVTIKTVTTSDWTEDTTSQVGTTLYKKSIALNHVYVESPNVDIGSIGVLPTNSEQESYRLLKYVTIDNTIPCLYLYSGDIPETTFYINVIGVD